MKRIYIAIVVFGAVSAIQAAIVASDDFSSGTVGTEINGVAVQSGSGTWTDAGILNPLEFGAGGVASIPAGASSGHAAVSTVYPSQTNTLTVTSEFSVGSSKANNPGVVVGFYETINKSFLQNLSADDIVGVRLLTSGANEGKLAWQIYDEGVAKDLTFEGSTVAFASNDVVRLTLSYNLQSGIASAEAYNITQDSLINIGITSVPGVNGFQYAGLGVADLIINAADPFYFDSFQVEAVPFSSASYIASDDFSSGTLGAEINGVAVQSGSGMWTDAGALNPLEFGAGGLAVIPTGASSGHAVISSDYSSYTNTLKITTMFSVGSSKANNPGVTVGFYETINKSFLQNLSADDIMGVRLLTSGGSEGKLAWLIYDEGVAKDLTFEGSTVAFASNDVVRLTLSYNLQSGIASAEAYNITQDSLINTGIASVAGVNGFNYAGMGVASLLTTESDSFYFDSVLVEAIAGGYTGWASGWGVDIGAESSDYDHDGLLNIYEYGLGGDPTNGFDQGISPEYSVDAGTFTYVYPQLSDPNSGISYHLVLNTDLVNGAWTNDGYIVTGTNVVVGDSDYVTNTTTTAEGKKFIRLIIE